jgi:hypothetical protein
MNTLITSQVLALACAFGLLAAVGCAAMPDPTPAAPTVTKGKSTLPARDFDAE